MFSPSLISMIFHSFGPSGRGDFGASRAYENIEDIAKNLAELLKAFPEQEATIPVVGRTNRPDNLQENILLFVTTGRAESSPQTFFWGRIPINSLISFFVTNYATSPAFEYLDFGTPVHELGSGSSHDAKCSNLLALSGNAPSSSTNPATVGAAIIDTGEDHQASPDDYNGKLRHAVTNSIALSNHAEKVLSVLLERLQKNGALPTTTLSCALVRPGKNIKTGRSCFDQSSAAEMLSAITDLEIQLTADNLPTVVNMSLGTHVGPHNGQSPLEEFISGTLSRHDRFGVVAAGNDGGAGRSAMRQLRANETEFFSIQSGVRCEELLLEFWWEDQNSPAISFEADIWEIDATGARTNRSTVTLNSSSAGANLIRTPAGLPSNMVMSSLFSSKCYSSYSCCAFAISSQTKSPLPQLQIYLGVESSRDITINAWVVVAEAHCQSSFLESGTIGSIMVPASEPSVLSVAGIQASGQMWKDSSRGPAAIYDWTAPVITSPMMAHRADLGSEFGTSYASPRACADAVETLSNPIKRARCHDALTLLSETYGLTNLGKWDDRFGFYKETKI